MAKHIEEDFVGISGRQRFTCLVCGATIVQQPYMSYEEWQEMVNEFAQAHSGH